MKKILLLLAIAIFLVGCSHSGHMSMHHDHSIASEKEFVVEMIPHHQEAVDTALLVLETTENEQMKDLAQRIISAQEQEIAMMQQWVESYYEGGYPARYQNMMPDLVSLQGADRDLAFLEGMILHHEGAVMMAEQVLTMNPRAEVADFANQVIKVQADEIQEMQELMAQY